MTKTAACSGLDWTHAHGEVAKHTIVISCSSEKYHLAANTCTKILPKVKIDAGTIQELRQILVHVESKKLYLFLQPFAHQPCDTLGTTEPSLGRVFRTPTCIC